MNFMQRSFYNAKQSRCNLKKFSLVQISLGSVTQNFDYFIVRA